MMEVLKTKVLAASPVGTTPISGLEVGSLHDLVTIITNILIVAGVAIVVVMLALGFIKYVTSQGDKAAVDSAQKTLTYAVIGGVGLLIVYGLRSLLLGLIGADTGSLDSY